MILICHSVAGRNFLVRGVTLSANNQDMESPAEMESAVVFTLGVGYEIPLNNTFRFNRN